MRDSSWSKGVNIHTLLTEALRNVTLQYLKKNNSRPLYESVVQEKSSYISKTAGKQLFLVLSSVAEEVGDFYLEGKRVLECGILWVVICPLFS